MATKEMQDLDQAEFDEAFETPQEKTEVSEDEAFGLSSPEIPAGDADNGTPPADSTVESLAEEVEGMTSEAPADQMAEPAADPMAAAPEGDPMADAAPAEMPADPAADAAPESGGEVAAGMDIEAAVGDESMGGDAAPAGLPPEVQSAVDLLTQDFGAEFVEAVKTVANHFANESGINAANSRFGELSKNIESAIAGIEDWKTAEHFGRIFDAHPDFAEVKDSPAFEQWKNGLSPDQRARADEVAASGTARQVIAMLNAFKEATKGASEAEDDAVGVRSTGLQIPDRPEVGEDDFAAAWDRA